MLFDLHNDILTANIPDAKLSHFLSDYATNTDIFRTTLAVWTTKTALPLNTILQLFSIAARFNKDKKFCYAIEDLHFLDYSCIDFLSFVKEKFNVIYAGLTWNYENSLAGGALSTGSLTSFGKDVISKLEDSNILVDTAHLNKQSFWDVLNNSKNIVINSHCCFDSVNSHPRNLDNDQIKAIIERGGIIGLTLVPEFLSKKSAKLVDCFNHIDYFINMFGCDNLSIGTDFFGSTSYPDGLNKYSDFPALVSLMKSAGYPSAAIESILFKNAKRIIIEKNN